MPTIPPLLTFLGAAGTVTGSRFLFEASGSRVLVDAGLFQGQKELRLRNRAPLGVDPASLDAVVLTHAHLDHTGFLPALAKAGMTAPIHATPATAELARIILEDSAKLQEEQAAHANREGYSRHRPALPLYTSEDAARAIELLSPVALDQPVTVADGVEASLVRAGHILGSASALLTLDGAVRAVVSGDLGRPWHPLLRPPAPRPEADVVLVESTYGDRRQADHADARAALAAVVNRTADRGGVLVIPAFAVDRTEVLLHALAGLRAEGAIPELPVHVDSPMGLAVLEVYRRAIDRGDDDVRPEVTEASLGFGLIRQAQTRDESIALNDITSPCVIVSSSGMATGGRVLHHLKRRLADPRNTIALVGYQAKGTRGRRLAEGEPAVKLLGRYIPVRAEVVQIDGFSVHADADELVAWLGSAPPPATTYVVHGEPAASAALRDRAIEDLDHVAVIPAHGERVRLD